MRYINILLCMVILATIISCEDYYKDGGTHSTAPLRMTSIEYIESRPDIFDTTLIVLRKSGLDKVIEEGNVTFFIPQKKSILRMLRYVNNFVDNNKDSLGYEKDTVMIDDIKPETWRKYMSRYIFEGNILRDDIEQGVIVNKPQADKELAGGAYYESYMGYDMLLYLDHTKWQNIEGAGPKFINIVDMKEDFPEEEFVNTRVISSNIRTSNGTIHVLGKGHTFGFDSNKHFIEAKNQ